MRSEGGIVWACKNYDRDVMSSLASAFGGSPMMTYVFMSSAGYYEYELVYGIVQRYYYKLS